LTNVLRRFAFVLFALISLPALADPPTRVGRISLTEGAASLRHGDNPQWLPAPLNYPVIQGDSLWVDHGSRAEIQVGGAELRLGSTTLVTILRMDDAATVIRVDQGVANLYVRFIGAPLQLVTAVGALDVREPGDYHVDSGRPDGPPTQIVMGTLQGVARFSGLRGEVELHSGQGAMVPPDQSTMSVVGLAPTPFDQWCEDRAMAQAMAQSTQFVSEEVVGIEDLDAYGRWEMVPGYGMVWFPSQVEIGWAPYRYGQWAFVEPWGWTWIDEAPWGFAPFHYGRWASFEGRWCWIPGERHEHQVYAPALVTFIGGHPGEGGDVRWIPLGPHEHFHPYYRASDAYERNLNHPHGADQAKGATASFANQHAVSGVSAGTFTGGQAVHRNLAPPQAAQPGAPALNNLNHLQPQPAQPAQPTTPAAQPGFHPQAVPPATTQAPAAQPGFHPQAAPAAPQQQQTQRYNPPPVVQQQHAAPTEHEKDKDKDRR